MNDIEKTNSGLKRFKLSGLNGIVAIVAVAIVAFSIGGIYFAGSADISDSSHETAEQSSEGPTTWTCSMHPQIKLPKPGKCPLCFMDLIPVESGDGEELDPRQIRLSETAVQLAQIETTPATKAFGEAEIRLVGTITFDETLLTDITAWVGGRLDRLFADYTGMTVNKGDHMVYMYSPELVAAQEELLQAKSAIARLGTSSSNMLRSTAESTITSARKKLLLYGLTQNQIDEIESDGEISDHLTINAPAGGVVVRKEAQEGSYVKTGDLIYTIADLSQLWVVFEAYESDLPWLRYGQKVSFASNSFPGKTFDGLISFIDPVVSQNSRTVRVRAVVDNSDFRLKPDMFVKGTVRSRIDGSGKVVDAALAGKYIAPMHPEIVKDGPGTCDRCGMDLVSAESLGYAKVVADESDAPILIPATAPLITGKRAIVYVALADDNGPLFEGREIELGPRAGDFYVVQSGISEGEQIVTNGAFKLDSELQIRAKPSMMSPDGGAAQTGHEHHAAQVSDPVPMRMEMPSEPTNEDAKTIAALTPVYDNYFSFQMALASDDLDASKAASDKLGKSASEFDMTLFTPIGHDKWMKISEVIADQSKRASSADDIETARDAFFYLSNAIIDLHDSFGHSDKADYFLTFCPMARNDQGAHWLQTVDTVYNSFYGASMLRCGIIKKPLSSNSEMER